LIDASHPLRAFHGSLLSLHSGSMLPSNRHRVILACVPACALLTMSVACSNAGSKAAVGDASADVGRAKKTSDGGSDAKSGPVDATAGCGLCSRDAAGHSGNDASD